MTAFILVLSEKRRHLWSTVHHWHLVWQYLSSGKPTWFTGVRYLGDDLGLTLPPRIGSRMWVTENGHEVHSDEIRTFEDRSYYGY
jgi:hypothetical protein